MVELSKNIFDYFASLYGNSAAAAYKEFIQTEHKTWLRKKANFSEHKLIEDLRRYDITIERENSIDGAYKVTSGSEKAGKTILHILGKYYIQSLSSMIPPLILAPHKNELVIDLCAAPGSKTTQIADLMNNEGTFISNEISVDRVKMLIHNIDRMNFINTGVLNQKGELLSKLYANYFDKVLVDAPCSALGVLQKKQEVSNWWNEDRISVIASIQVKLLIAGIKMLKPGGELVYSTCTLTPEENELVVDKVLSKYPVRAVDIEIPLPSKEGFTSYKGEKLHPDLIKLRRILPWEANSEGFSIIKLRKTAPTEDQSLRDNSSRETQFITHNNASIKEHLAAVSDLYGINKERWDQFKFIYKGNDLFFTDHEWSDLNPSRFTRIGTRFGTINKNNKMQMHSYAAQYFCNEIDQNLYIIEDVQVLRNYISGGIIRTGSEAKSAKIIKYNDMVLGTAITVHNGLKSQFPKSKRMQEIIFEP